METCPFCGGGAVRRASSQWRHALRLLCRSPKRYCPSCGGRWHDRSAKGTRSWGVVFAAAAAAALLAAFLGRGLGTRLGWTQAEAGKTAGVAWLAASAGPGAGKESDGLIHEAGAPGGGDSLGPVYDHSMPQGNGGGSGGGRGALKPHVSLEQSQEGAGLSRSLQDIATLMKLLKDAGLQKETVLRDVDTLDKKELWDKYGHFFSSKEQAKSAYQQYQSKKHELSQSAEPEQRLDAP